MAESPEIAIRALLPFCARQRQMSFVEGSLTTEFGWNFDAANFSEARSGPS
jgi:hypothetical protein